MSQDVPLRALTVLVGRMLEQGGLSSEDQQALQAALNEGSAAQAAYLDLLLLEELLKEEFLGAGGAAREPIGRLEPAAASGTVRLLDAEREALAAAPSAARPGSLWRSMDVRRHPVSFTLWVAALTLVTWSLFFFSVGDRAVGRKPVAAAPAGPPIVARVTQTDGCEWNDPADALAVGASLSAGRTLRLAAGLIEITMHNKTRVLVEGPAVFQPLAADRCALEIGRLVADAAPSKPGFTVQAPAGTIVDLGTQFGVWVATDGATEVHVMSGRVRLEPMADPDASRPSVQMLGSGQSSRMAAPTSAAPERVQPIEYAEGLFVKTPPAKEQLTKDRGPGGLDLTSHAAQLVLWLKGDALSELDGATVANWPDSSGHGNHARALGTPMLRKLGVGERRVNVVAFDGRQAMFTTPVKVTYPFTVIAVAREQRRHIGAIVGHARQSEFDLQLGDVLWNGEDLNHGQWGLWSASRDVYCNAAARVDQQFCVLSCVIEGLDLERQWSLFKNGHGGLVRNTSQLEHGEPLPQIRGVQIGAGTGQSEFWDGEIAEVLIYRRALGSSERSLVERALALKYGLPSALADLTASRGSPPAPEHYVHEGFGLGPGMQRSGAAGLSLAASTPWEPNEFVFASHAEPANRLTDQDLPDGVRQRWRRDWRLEVGAKPERPIRFTFDASGGQVELSRAARHVLLYRAQNHGPYRILSREGTQAEHAGAIHFTCDHAASGFYTLGVE